MATLKLGVLFTQLLQLSLVPTQLLVLGGKVQRAIIITTHDNTIKQELLGLLFRLSTKLC